MSTVKSVGLVSVLTLMNVGAAFAQDNDSERKLETVTVTGSFIQGTPEDAALPVDVLTAADLKLEGRPTITELIRNLGVSSGVDGQTNQFGANGLEGTSNVNLRGLGPGRSLVLLNGKRETFSPFAIGEQAQLFIDTNLIPTAAVNRVELLKDGAAALYGSDAIAGVVNFITRDSFEGFEIGGEFQTFEGSDGEFNISAIGGIEVLGGNWVTSVGYQFRNEVDLLERDFAIQSFEDNPVGGFSTIGNPGSFVALPNVGPGSALGSPLAFANADEQCETLGGIDAGVLCRFQFTQFDNLVEREEKLQIFSEFNRPIGDNMNLHLEGLYSTTSVPDYETSPSFPPQALFGQVVSPDHPGLQQFLIDNPGFEAETFTDFAPLLTGGAPVPNGLDSATTPLIFFGRSFGFGGFPGTGGAQQGFREYEHFRVSGGLDGDFLDGALNWDVDATYAQTNAEVQTPDTFTAGFSAALQGFGLCADAATGEIPVGAVAGQGGCEYYNPFSNAIAANAITGDVNPQFDPALANSPELADWLTDLVGSERQTSLFVVDGVVSGDTGFELGGGNLGFAAGFQFRDESFESIPNDISNLALNPGPTGTGVFSFLAGGDVIDDSQSIYAFFGELQVPLSDRIDIQVAARFEDYGGNTGSTFDPKVAAKFQVTDEIAIRGSAQTSFRGPTLNQLSESPNTTLQFIAPTGSFRAVDQIGSPDLAPESALSFNIGTVWDTDFGFSGSIDYYNFDFSDPIIVEDQNSVVNAVLAALADGDADAAILDRVTFDDPANPTGASIQRIGVNITNGPDIQTSGIDLRFEQVWETVGDSELSVGFDGTYVLEYEVADFEIEGVLFEGEDRVGQFNRSNFSRSLPDWKANLYANYAFGDHNFRTVWRAISSYEDERPAAQRGNVGEEIDAQITVDAFYNYSWDAFGADFSLSVVNVLDEDPPFAAFDLNYDPFTHNPFGRTFKVGFTKAFGAAAE